MKSCAIYRQTVAYLLAALVFQAIALKEVHHVFGHEHKVAHCETNNFESHLHGEDYAPLDCSICFFNFAPATLEFQEIKVDRPASTIQPLRFFYHAPLSTRVNWHFPLRGPPCFAA